MSARNRGPPPSIKGGMHPGLPLPHEPAFGRGPGRMPHPALIEEMRESQFGMGHRPPPPHPAILEERLAAQYQDIQGMLTDNQGLAATHVALKQELELAQYELERTSQYLNSLNAGKDMQMREMHDKSAKLEADLRRADDMKKELMQVRGNIKELTAVRQDLMGQVQLMTQDLARAKADLQQVPAVKADVDAMRQELQRAKSAIEYEKKGYAENFEHGQAMEKKLVAMARELEKLRSEIGNGEKRTRAAAAVSNPGYVATEVGYAGNPYPVGYGMNPQAQAQPTAENYPHYGLGPGVWGAYDMQRAQGHR